MSTPTAFTTRTGRIVWAGGDDGTLYTPKSKDFDGNPLVVKSGANIGQPTCRYEFGLAIKKQPNEQGWWTTPEGAVILAQGQKDHPQSSQRTDFAWKVTDGDSTVPGKAKQGKPGRRPCDKEGFSGHWVFSFSGSFPFKFVNANGTAYLLEPNAVKVGDYVQVAGEVVGNTGATPGVYLNHRFIALQGYGEPITSGPDPSTLGLGGGPQPAGMSSTPIGALKIPAPGAAPAAPALPLPAVVPGAPVAQPAVPPPLAVQPHPGFLQPPGGLAGPPAAAIPQPPVVASPAGPVLTAKALGTYEAYRAAGWSDQQLRAQGLLQ